VKLFARHTGHHCHNHLVSSKDTSACYHVTSTHTSPCVSAAAAWRHVRSLTRLAHALFNTTRTRTHAPLTRLARTLFNTAGIIWVVCTL
jgi:hypothetical protein